MKGHKKKVAERDHQLLRPGAGDLIGPEREKISPLSTRMGERGPDAGGVMDRVSICEEKVTACRISCSGKLMAGPVFTYPTLGKFPSTEKSKGASLLLSEG